MFDDNYKLQYDDLPKDKIIRPRRIFSTRERIVLAIIIILLTILSTILEFYFPRDQLPMLPLFY